MEGYAPTATFTLAETAARLSREQGATVHVGPIVTSGIFYDPDSTTFSRWKRLGHLGVEMEAAMLYTIAAVKGDRGTGDHDRQRHPVGDRRESERISDDELKPRRRRDDAPRLPPRRHLIVQIKPSSRTASRSSTSSAAEASILPRL